MAEICSVLAVHWCALISTAVSVLQFRCAERNDAANQPLSALGESQALCRVEAADILPLSVQGRHQDAERKYNKAMHYLDPDSFEAEGPGVSADEVTQLGHAFIPCLLNRYKHVWFLPHPVSLLACLRLLPLRIYL